MTLKYPKVRIPGISLNYTEKEFETIIRSQNKIILDDDLFKITFVKTFQTKHTKTIIAECSPKVFKELMCMKKIYVDGSVFQYMRTLVC